MFTLCLCGLVAVGCGDDESSSGGSSGSQSTPEAKKIKVGLVTDIGGLNDRSFNQLANEGFERAKSSSSTRWTRTPRASRRASG